MKKFVVQFYEERRNFVTIEAENAREAEDKFRTGQWNEEDMESGEAEIDYEDVVATVIRE